MQNDEQLFGFIDASIRKECAQKAIQEEPWAGGVPGIGLVKRNDINFLAGAQKRETNTSLKRDGGGHSGGSLPSPMDSKNANGSDAQMTPHLMGMSPDADDLAESAWLNESANLDEIDIEELANGTTILELVDLPDKQGSTEHPGATAESQETTQTEPATDMNAPDDLPLQHPPEPPVIGGAAEPHSTAPYSSVQPTSVPPKWGSTPEAELLEQLQHLAAQPTQEEEFQKRLDALRSDQPVEGAPGAPGGPSIDERFAQVQRMVHGNVGAANEAGPSTSAGVPPPAVASTSAGVASTSAGVASTSSGLGAQLHDFQAQTLAGAGTGSHEDEVKELLAQLKDTLSHAPPTQPDGEGVEDEDSVEISSDDEQVRALVERAALGEFDEVPDEPEEESDAPSPPPVSLDDQLKQQWHRDWEEQEERQGQAHLSSELSCELGKNEALRASIAEQQSTIQPNPQPLTSDLGATVEWSAKESQRQDVKDAKELLDKLQHCNKQPPGHERMPLWKAAIALRASSKGMEALQEGHLKLATFLNHIVEAAAGGASLQPGDLLQVENFRLKFHKTSALLKAQSIAQQASKHQGQAPVEEPDTPVDLPDVPTHKPDL